MAMRAGDTPVPIPNTTVKTCAADGTMLGTAWESRRLPERPFSHRGEGGRDGMHLENFIPNEEKTSDIQFKNERFDSISSGQGSKES